MCILYFTSVIIDRNLNNPLLLEESVTSTNIKQLEPVQQKFAALCFNTFILKVHYSYFHAVEQLQFYTSHIRTQHLDALSLIQINPGSKFSVSVLKLMVFEILLVALEILFCSLSAPQVNNAPLLGPLQLLMLFERKLTYFDPNLF
jgi:hypothetical protein